MVYSFLNIFEFLGGVALVVYGVHLSGVNFQKLLGSYLEQMIRNASRSVWLGVFLGFLVTALIHSGSTVAIILNGLMWDGFLTLSAALPIMLGAGIGSTVAAQLASLRIGTYALVFLFAGTVLHLGSNHRNLNRLGEAVIGLSFLFLGMELIMTGVSHFLEVPEIARTLDFIAEHSLWAVYVGAILTLLFQSSTAAAITIIALGISAPIPLATALFMVLGINLGKALRVLYLTLRHSEAYGNLAIFNLLFNLFSFVLLVVFFDQLYALVVLSAAEPARQIANAYTLYALISALIFLPFVFILAKVWKVAFGIPRVASRRAHGFALDRKLICTPSVSIAEVNRASVSMSRSARKMLDDTFEILEAVEPNTPRKLVARRENGIDRMTAKLATYVMHIASQNLSRRDAIQLYSLIGIVSSIEHLCDHIMNVANLFVQVRRQRVVLSPQAQRELMGLHGKLRIMQNLTTKALEENNGRLAQEIIEHENKVDEIIKKIMVQHTVRVENGECSPVAASFYEKILNNLERVGDHYDNLAYSIADRFARKKRQK